MSENKHTMSDLYSMQAAPLSVKIKMTATNDELVKRFIAKEKAMNLSIEIVKRGGKNE